MIILLVILAEFSLLPLELASPFYWLGFVVWFSIGALLIMSRNGRITRVGGMLVGVLAFPLIVLSRNYPEAGSVAAALPGIFVGMLARFLVIAFVDSKTAYCNICRAQTVMDKKEGRWFCVSGNHFVGDANAQADVETTILGRK